MVKSRKARRSVARAPGTTVVSGVAEGQTRYAAAGALAAEAEAEILGLIEGDTLPPVHPGEILAEDFLPDAGLSVIKAAQRISVPRTRLERLVAGQTSMTPDTALRLERLFGASAQFWMNLQAKHDLDLARAVVAPALTQIVPVFGAEPAAKG
jgi:addiction module HigA family antidote